jgi:hypothetical protein
MGMDILSMQAAWVGIPVSAVTVSDPPVTNIEVTIMFVASPKNMNVKWAPRPHRARMTSRKVWACGALILSLTAFWEKMRIWTLPVDEMSDRARED